MKIVIVDDDKQAAYDLEARLLKSYKIEVAGVALIGLDGLALVNKHRPDVLFLDVQLPDISGLDFLDRIDDFTDGDCRDVYGIRQVYPACLSQESLRCAAQADRQ